jgi:hypothetical protein
MVRGSVALIGSGELSATMVEMHKMLMTGVEEQGKTIFLDTPAGFQENVDLLSRRAVEYFKNQVGQSMEVASFKSTEFLSSPEAEKTYHLVGEAGYVLIGPGSPTYTVRQLKETPIPALLSAMVTRGGCLSIASAAALTAGSHTLPVYEIYKVGEPLHWIEGLNIVGNLGLDLVVIPHWNNAEGGNHDTRFCYMGERRFRSLEKDLPSGTTILGIDEHTACILNFSSREALVEGIGQVTIRCDGVEKQYGRHEKIGFDELLCMQEGLAVNGSKSTIAPGSAAEDAVALEVGSSFWQAMHDIERNFYQALEDNDTTAMVTMLLEADRLLWQGQLELENPEFISQGRELYREMIVLAGTGINRASTIIPRKFVALVNALVDLREDYRQEKRWSEADGIRNILQSSGVVLEDTEEGPRWRY